MRTNNKQQTIHTDEIKWELKTLNLPKFMHEYNKRLSLLCCIAFATTVAALLQTVDQKKNARAHVLEICVFWQHKHTYKKKKHTHTHKNKTETQRQHVYTNGKYIHQQLLKADIACMGALTVMSQYMRIKSKFMRPCVHVCMCVCVFVLFCMDLFCVDYFEPHTRKKKIVQKKNCSVMCAISTHQKKTTMWVQIFFQKKKN